MQRSPGYHAVASFLDMDTSVPIIRRFGVLNTQNLLYMQAELVQLERELECIVDEDARSHDAERIKYRHSARALQKSSQGGDDFQWRKILEIREKLQHYNEAVIRYDKLRSMPQPTPWSLNNIRHILNISKHSLYYLRDLDAESWDVKNEYDLIALQRPGEEPDRFTKWTRESLLPWIHRHFHQRTKTPDFETGLVPYDDKKIHIFITLLRSGLAMMFPAATMIVLYTVSRMLFRLLLVFVFSTLFTAVIALCTRARAIETFMATAAFASVQVVFVGATSNTGTS